MAKFSSLVLVAVLASLSSAIAASWNVNDINLSVTAKNGAKKADHKLEYPYAVEDLKADNSDILKFSFKVENKERPHQAMVVFQSQDEFQDEIMVAAAVKPSGKGRFEINFAKADPKFRYNTRKFSMTFLVGGSKVEEPFKYALGHIEVQGPSANPAVRPSRVAYEALDEIHHQFRADQKLINRAVSGLFSLLVLAPFAALFLLWSQLGIKFEPLKAMAQRPLELVAGLVFFSSLAAIEFVFYSYWTHVTLFPVLQYLGVLSLVALVSGRSVLSSVQTRRLQRTQASSKKDL
ncbi:oligosaccharyltransferase complex subunit delta (ribophorin II) [Entomortierella parvispora]|uniref:Ribophorin II n=1 Tax=Entomortierella parvispora TaxID=205924 RepID=A0A9P3LV41_9FUNG|nr:oligosaccharyltransferase complex subunit delta (ribophorin II) [Entomortierella parvispora]